MNLTEQQFKAARAEYVSRTVQARVRPHMAPMRHTAQSRQTRGESRAYHSEKIREDVLYKNHRDYLDRIKELAEVEFSYVILRGECRALRARNFSHVSLTLRKHYDYLDTACDVDPKELLKTSPADLAYRTLAKKYGYSPASIKTLLAPSQRFRIGNKLTDKLLRDLF